MLFLCKNCQTESVICMEMEKIQKGQNSSRYKQTKPNNFEDKLFHFKTKYKATLIKDRHINQWIRIGSP